MTKDDFTFVCQLAKQHTAIDLQPGKEYLVETRLSPLAKSVGFDSLHKFIQQLRLQTFESRALRDRALDALTTNETSFFRDSTPFEALRTVVLPELIAAQRSVKRLSIWSAACSTGQEIYSLAMILRDHFPELHTWNVRLFATDISSSVLEKAKAGRYNRMEVTRGLPEAMRERYFREEGLAWQIDERIRSAVEFKQMNFIDPWPSLENFNLIFIRNVLIYFDLPTKQKILGQVRRHLYPNGYMMLGSMETTMNVDPNWTPRSCGGTTVYAPVQAAAVAHKC